MTPHLKNYYSASLFYNSFKNGLFSESNLWEEEIIILQASSLEDAYELARAIGKEKEVNYENFQGVKIEWKFHKIERVFEITENHITHGSAVFSRFLRNSEAVSLLTPFDDK